MHRHNTTHLYEGWKGGTGWLVNDEKGEVVVADQGRSTRAGAMTTTTVCICHFAQSVTHNEGKTATHSVRQVKKGRSIGFTVQSSFL